MKLLLLAAAACVMSAQAPTPLVTLTWNPQPGYQYTVYRQPKHCYAAAVTLQTFDSNVVAMVDLPPSAGGYCYFIGTVQNGKDISETAHQYVVFGTAPVVVNFP